MDKLIEFKLEGLNDFKLIDILDNGQCFRWNSMNVDNTEYVGVVNNNVYILKEEVIKEDKYSYVVNLNIKTTDSKENATNFLVKYFDLEKDYSKIKKDFLENEKIKNSMQKAIEFGKGIRILKQDKLEMIISFIISSNNRIPRIKSIIERICEKKGREIIVENKKYYTFPTLSNLKTLTKDDFKEMGAGFRNKYLYETIKVLDEDFIENLESLEDEELFKNLQKLNRSRTKSCKLYYAFWIF